MVFGLTEELKIKVTAEKECTQTVTVEWPLSKVKEKIEAAFQVVQGKAKLPGFRPGKTPLELVRKNFAGAAYEEAQDLLLREGVAEAVKAKKINLVQTPVITSANFSPDKPFTFEFQAEVAPTFKLGAYKGLKITFKEKQVTTEDLEKAIKNVADMNARLIESKAEVLAETHYAVVDYQGFIDGTEIQGGKAENFLLDMSAPQAIQGLAEGLKGAKAGEERNIEVTFPADSPAKELAGKKANFKVKLSTIKEKLTPELGDDLAKDLGFKTFDELKARVKENLETETKQNNERQLRELLSDKLVEENEFALPKTVVENQIANLKSRQSSYLIRQGFPQAEIDKLMESRIADLKKQAEKDVRLAYILDEITNVEKLAASESEIEEKIKEVVASASVEERDSLDKALRTNLKSRVEEDIKEKKIFDLLIQNSKIKEK